MVTTLNISDLSEIKSDFITNILKTMLSSFGEIEITIKPKAEAVKTEIFRRIQDVENGAEMLYFTENEFDELNKKLLAGIKPDKSKIRKIRKHEPIGIISK